MEPRILTASEIYTGHANAFAGFLAIDENGKIAACGPMKELEGFISTHPWRLTNCGEESIMPGWADQSVFFPGYVAQHAGCDLQECKSLEQCIEKLKQDSAARINDFFYGHNTPSCALRVSSERLDEVFGKTPVVMMAHSRYCCSMNTAAKERFQFDENCCYSERYDALLAELTRLPVEFERHYRAFNRYLLANGITAARDIGYDDLDGRLERLEQLKKKGEIAVKLAVVSQPNRDAPDFEKLVHFSKQYASQQLRFCGLKLMADDMTLFGAEDSYQRPKDQTSYQRIAKWTREADAAGLRVSLHADGDRAVGWAVALLAGLPNSRALHHSIISASLIRPDDATKLRDAGLMLELYPTILGAKHQHIVKDTFTHSAFVQQYLSAEEQEYYLNYAQLAQMGISLCCGSDLPYMPFGPEQSVRCAVRRIDGWGKVFMPNNGLTVPQLLNAWSKNGYAALGLQGGCLEAGNPADFVILDHSLTSANVQVRQTCINGNVVYEKGA